MAKHWISKFYPDNVRMNIETKGAFKIICGKTRWSRLSKSVSIKTIKIVTVVLKIAA